MSTLAGVFRLLERWTSAVVNHDSPGAYRLMGILNNDEPYLTELLDFLRTHRGHHIRAQLTAP